MAVMLTGYVCTVHCYDVLLHLEGLHASACKI